MKTEDFDIPIIVIEESNFHNAWWRILERISQEGRNTRIGGLKSPQSEIRDACVIVKLKGQAISQLKRHEIHPQFPLKHIVESYCREFTFAFMREQKELPRHMQFDYTYFERLTKYPTSKHPTDQLLQLRYKLKEQIETGKFSNRNQLITWDVSHDIDAENPPCLQRIQFFYLGEHKFVVLFDWRSRDAYKAWPINLVGLVYMLYEHVLNPLGCEIEQIIDFSSSLHIYDVDIEEADGVNAVPI